MLRAFALALVLVASTLAPDARAGGVSAWYETEGARIRLVTASETDDASHLRGALQIELEPGWKTYWMDPGDAGIPPAIDLSEDPFFSGAELLFPAPKRFDDGYSVFAGYDRSVSLPVRFQPSGARITRFNPRASVFLGVCREICVPVQAEFKAERSGSPDNVEAIIDAAFAMLPREAAPGEGVTDASLDGRTLRVATGLPAGAGVADLFLAAPAGYAFGTPHPSEEAGRLVFSVPVLRAPKAAPGGTEVNYTLAGRVATISGRFHMP